MKNRIILCLLGMVSLSMLIINCSNNEESVQMNGPVNRDMLQRKATDSINVGYFDINDDFIVYPDSISEIKSQWEKNYSASITGFSIEKRLTIANPDDITDVGGESIHFLIGKTLDGREINLAVSKNGENVLAPGGPTLSVTCSGCSVGCRIESYKDTDKKLKYRCAVPCGACSKSETLTNARKQ